MFSLHYFSLTSLLPHLSFGARMLGHRPFDPHGSNFNQEYWNTWEPERRSVATDRHQPKKTQRPEPSPAGRKASHVVQASGGNDHRWWRLSAEIRSHIYELVFAQRHPLVSNNTKVSGPDERPSLWLTQADAISTSPAKVYEGPYAEILLTCRLVYAEAWPIFCKCNTFSMQDPAVFATSFLRVLLPTRIYALQRLHLRLNPNLDSWDTERQKGLFSVLRDYPELKSLNSITITAKLHAGSWMDIVKGLDEIRRTHGPGLRRGSAQEARHFWTSFAGALRTHNRFRDFFVNEWPEFEVGVDVVWMPGLLKNHHLSGLMFVLQTTRKRP